MPFSRYGIYFTPPSGPFAAAGAEWLGWDSAAGRACAATGGALTERPRKYGFHATLKAPFALAGGADPEKLAVATADLARGLSPVPLEGLAVDRMGSFLALTPAGDVTDLRALAKRVVITLDGFRAPLTDAERARKTRPDMPADLRENLENYGYPHVLDRFTFHMTLTGPLSASARDVAMARARAHFDGTIPDPLMLDGLTLVGEDVNGFFRHIERFPLEGRAG